MSPTNTPKNEPDINWNKRLYGKRFEVGKDDLPIDNLTFEEIDFIMKTIAYRDNSPLSLHFRIMENQSALKLITRDIQPFKKDGSWRYLKSYTLACYNSLKYQGYGNAFDSDKYIEGGQLWSISAAYGYEIDEKEAMPNSNKPFMHKNRYVYHRTEQPNKTYEMKHIIIEDQQRRIQAFLKFYFDLKKNLTHTNTWVDQKLDMIIRCECGHEGKLNYNALVGLLTKESNIDCLTSRFKCNSCAKKGAVKAFPIYSECTPKRFIHQTAWAPFSRHRAKKRVRTAVQNPELRDMYKNVGGDGENPAYLSDGAYLSPNGEVSED
jgi:hypothetical protein